MGLEVAGFDRMHYNWGIVPDQVEVDPGQADRTVVAHKAPVRSKLVGLHSCSLKGRIHRSY